MKVLRKAFTLVEIMTAAAIMAVAGAVIFVLAAGVFRSSQETSAKNNASAIDAGIASYCSTRRNADATYQAATDKYGLLSGAGCLNGLPSTLAALQTGAPYTYALPATVNGQTVITNTETGQTVVRN